MENSAQELKVESKKSFWSYLLLLVFSFCIISLFPVAYGAYERTGDFIFVIFSWALAVSSIVILFYVVRNKAEVLGFFAFFHALLMIFVSFQAGPRNQLMLKIFERNMLFMILDSFVLGIIFFISLVKLKQAINKKNSKEIMKFALFSFFTMILSPLSFFIVIFGAWGINGD